MNFIDELEVGGLILADVSSFEQGIPVNASPTIGGQKLSVAVAKLRSGPVPPYETVTGTLFAEVFEALSIGEEFASGGTIAVAMKLGSAWYGITASKATS